MSVGSLSGSDQINSGAWIARELKIVNALVGLGLLEFDRDLVTKAANEKEVTVHDRFLPGGLTLANLFSLLYAWNEVTEKKDRVKLFHNQGDEWWRTDNDVQSLPTQAGVLTICDFSRIVQIIRSNEHPFRLRMNRQVTWAEKQGGSGIMSAEQVVFLFIRLMLERQDLLQATSAVRCCNTLGSGSSLIVRWFDTEGFGVCSWDRSGWGWDLGAMPEVFRALDP